MLEPGRGGCREQSWREQGWAWLLRPLPADWLVALRVAYGLILSVSLLRFLHYGWVDRLFVEPSFHFKYWGLGWVGVLPGPLLHALFCVLAGLGLCVALGLFYRVAAWVLLGGFTYLQLLDVATYLNHYYLAVLLGLLLALSPAGQHGSLDALRRRRPAPAVRAFWLYLLRFQVGVVYVYAGLAKLHADWLIEAQPLGIWLGSHGDFPLLGVLFLHPAAPLAFSWAGFLFDTTIVFWLSWQKTRLPAYLVLIGFHALTALLFPIGLFPVIMTSAALVFLAPDWPRRLAARLCVRRSRAAGSAQAVPARPLQSAARVPSAAELQPAGTPARRAALALALGYCALQLLLPLRFVLYGDNVRWHEQGMRFSWRVMVREKNGSVHLRVTSEATGRRYEVSPRRYLTPLQEREMSGQPDLIAQLARHVRADFAARGLGPVRVSVDAWASLNGRRARRLIDPYVDLAEVELGLAPARWILPAPAEPPPPLGRGRG